MRTTNDRQLAGLHRHPLQKQAIAPILKNHDLIIQSATGSGKTEAVLAPTLEQIIQAKSPRTTLYIVPTRALTFDIRRRFASLLRERLNIHFAIRTGDLKHNAGGTPDIMLTTPESLDVLLGSSNLELKAFTSRIRTAIIDEVHPFLEQYRGRHLAYLLHRLERRTGVKLQKIALSATTPNAESSPACFNLKTMRTNLYTSSTTSIGSDTTARFLFLPTAAAAVTKFLRCLTRMASFRVRPNCTTPTLTLKSGKKIEQRFRQRRHSVCIATSTLELGIDVGDVDAVLLFEPPDSVSAFLQRIGRANRRQQIIHFWGICRGPAASRQALRFLTLLQLAAESKIETPWAKSFPSVLSQQIISCLYEKKELWLNLFPAPTTSIEATESAKGHGSQLKKPELFHENQQIETIFETLISKKWLIKGTVPGLYRGGWPYWQALTKYRTWSNFPENETEFKLEVAGEMVADIPQSTVHQFKAGDHVLLAGRRLQIITIDEEQHRVSATPSQRPEPKELAWLGAGSQISYEVAQAMRALLKSTNPEDNHAAPGLLQRTRNLIQTELEID